MKKKRKILKNTMQKKKKNIINKNINKNPTLIYCGPLRDECNIIEIIEEFKKIHKKGPEISLKIVYNEIIGNQIFTEKVDKYINEGVDGITFKHNLNNKEINNEISKSDFAIYWCKHEWDDNEEVSPNIKALKVDPNKLIILKNKLLLNYNIINTLYKINFIEKQYLNKFLDAVLEIKLNYKSNTKLYPYVLHSSLPYDLNGYATRSHNILKNFNKIYSDKKYFVLDRIGYPFDIHLKSQDDIDLIKK